MLSVPPPEPDWEDPAVLKVGGRRNPVQQFGMWEYAMGNFRILAQLTPPLADLLARLRLHAEASWEDLGNVECAFFRFNKVHFALSSIVNEGNTYLRIEKRSIENLDEVLGSLLSVLGLDRQAIVASVDPDGLWHYSSD